MTIAGFGFGIGRWDFYWALDIAIWSFVFHE